MVTVSDTVNESDATVRTVKVTGTAVVPLEVVPEIRTSSPGTRRDENNPPTLVIVLVSAVKVMGTATVPVQYPSVLAPYLTMRKLLAP